MNTAQFKINSHIGPLFLVASERGLKGVFFREQNIKYVNAKTPRAITDTLKKCEAQIGEFLAGTRRDFDLDYDIDGTTFQKKVWQQLALIPYGETRSYKDIAIAIKNEKACRAVGTANGANPLSIIVPCHRVIAFDGTLGGYGGGLTVKQKLLALENSLNRIVTTVKTAKYTAAEQRHPERA